MPADPPSTSPRTPREVLRYDILALVLLAAFALVHQHRAILFGEAVRVKDNAEVYEPQRAYYVQALREGRIPLWCPLLGVGFPYFSHGDPGVLYPLNLLTFSFFGPFEGDIAGGVLRLFLGSTFAYAAARVLGLGFWGGLLSGIVFAYNGFIAVQWFAYRGHFSWIEMPLAILAAERLVTRRRAWTVIWVSLVFGVSLLAGTFQLQMMAMMLFLWFGCWRALEIGGGARRLAGQAVRLVLPIALGTALAAVQLLPTWELRGFSGRTGVGAYEPPFRMPAPYGVWPSGELNATFGEDVREEWRTQFSFPPHHLVLYVFPYLWHLDDDAFWSLKTAAPEAFAYVGILPLALALLAGRRRRAIPAVGALAGGALVFTLLSFGPWVPGHEWLTRLPGFGFFSFSGRYVYPVSLCLAILAGAGLEAAGRMAWCEGRSALWRTGTGLMVVAILAFAAAVGERLWIHVAPAPPDVGEMASVTLQRMIRSLPVLLVSGAALWLLLRGWRGARWLVVGVTAAELAWFAWGYVGPAVGAQESTRSLAEPGPVIRRLPPPAETDLRHAGGPHSGRVIAGYRTLWFKLGFMPERSRWLYELNHRPYGDVAHLYRMLHVGYLLSREAIDDDRLERIYKGPDPQIFLLHGPRSFEWFLYACRDVLPRTFLVGRAEFVADGEEALRRIEDPAFDAAGQVILEHLRSDAAPPAPEEAEPETTSGRTSPGTCRIETDEERRTTIRVKADRPAWLFLSDLYYPGWAGFVDGVEVPVYQANYVGRALRIGPGEHEVEFRYQPRSMRRGLWISAVTLAVLTAAGGVVGVRRLLRRGRPEV